MKTNKKGITLIALVITIIILLIFQEQEEIHFLQV